MTPREESEQVLRIAEAMATKAGYTTSRHGWPLHAAVLFDDDRLRLTITIPGWFIAEARDWWDDTSWFAHNGWMTDDVDVDRDDPADV